MLRGVNALRARNIVCGARVLGASLVIGCAAGAGAQPPSEPPRESPTLTPARPAHAAPSPAEAIAAYRAVDAWLTAGGPPAEPVRADPASLHAACVTIRFEGRVVGRGLSFDGDGADLWRAAQRACEAAAETLRGTGALGGQRARLALDVELGGAPVPLVGETDVDLLSQINPGIDGIAVRAGEREGLTFPGQMLASGWTPAQGLMHAIAPLDLPPLDFQSLRNRYGLVVYRFSTEHLAQARAGMEPVFLERGTRGVSIAELTGARIARAADDAASFLMRLEWPGPEAHGIRGDYDPIAGVFGEAIAPPASQAIGAWALAVYSSSPGVDAANASRALRVSRRILADFTEVTEFETDPAGDAGALALWLVALRQSGGVDGFSADRRGAVEAFARSTVDRLMALSATPDEREGLAPTARALIALALAGAASDGDGPAGARERAQELARWLYVETDPGDLVSLMPWLGLASVELAGEGDISAQAALREMRSLVWRFTIPAVGADAGTADLIGGVVFTAGRTPLPSWQTLRPLAFLAVMAGDPRLTDASERGEAWTRLAESLRFAVQLQVDEACGHMMVRPELAVGAVRLAPWDQRCSVGATALALVSFCGAAESAGRAGP